MSRFKNFINFFKSLKFRLILFLILFGIVPGIVLKVGIVKTYEDRSVSIKTSEILSQAKILANQIVSNDYLNYPNSTIINAELDQLSNIYDGRVMVIDNEFHIIKDTYDLDTNKTIISKEVIESYYGQEIKKYDAENRYIELTVPLSRPVEQTGATEVLGVMLVSVSTDSINLNMEYLARNAYVIQLICAVAAVFLAVILSIQLVKPFHKMSKSIDEIKTGYGEDALSVNDYTETIEICKKFNEMLGRMKVLDDSRQEFVSNVSHELKTPLTSMKVLADSLVGQQGVPEELYQEFMGDITAEIDRENKIITDLLSLVKMDKKVQDLNIVSLNINDLTELILKRLRPIARKKDVEVVFESVRPVVAEVDEVKMTLIMTNLVENAIKYNKDHGWVKVILDADHQYFTFEVSDSGIGIPEEALAHICERFYRVDKSHSREIGGTGLGLAITKSAVLMHKGSLTVTSTEGQGSCFLAKIPLTYIAS